MSVLRATTLVPLLLAASPAPPPQSGDLAQAVREAQDRMQSGDPEVLEEAAEELLDLLLQWEEQLRDGSRIELREGSRIELRDGFHIERGDGNQFVDALATLARLPVGRFAEDAESHALFEQAREFVGEWGDAFWTANLDLLEAQRCMEHGGVAAAEALLARARERAAAYPALTPSVLATWAQLLRTQGETARALELLEAAKAAHAALLPEQQHGNIGWLGLCDVHGVEGQVYLQLGLADVAAVCYAEELAAARSYEERTGDPLLVHRAVARQLDLFVLARRYARVIAEATPLLQDPRLDPVLAGQLHVLLGIARAAGGASGRAAARAEFEEALALPDVTGIGRLTAELALAELSLDAGDCGAAERRLEQARALLAEPPEGRTELPFLRARRAALACRSAEESAAPRAEQERRLETLKRTVGELLDAWRRSPLRADGLNLLFDEGRRAVLCQLVHSLLALHPAAQEEALQVLLQVQAVGTLARRPEAPVPALADVRRQLLGPDTGLWLVLPSERRTVVMAMDREELVVEEVEGEARWRSLEPPFLPLGAALFPAPVGACLRRWQSLLVVGAELLGDVPVSALPWDGAEELLGLRFAVSLLPSIPVGMRLAGRVPEARPSLDLVLVTASRPSAFVQERWPDLPALPLDGAALEELQAPFPAERTRVLRDAGPSLLEDGAAAGAAMLHFFCHGVFAPELHQTTALVLSPTPRSPTGLLWAEDLRRQQVPELVVLSACGAARGPERFGEGGLEHLGGAFLQAGARAVVLSGADLEFHATLGFVHDFHCFLAAGATPAQALRDARREAAARPHAADFLAMQLLGLGDRPLFGPGAGRVPASREPSAGH